jgi:hypothetical protein
MPISAPKVNHKCIPPCGSVLLEKLMVSQPVREFYAFYGTRMFIIAFTRASHLSVYWARVIHSTPSSYCLKTRFNIIQSCTPRPKQNIIKICNFIFLMDVRLGLSPQWKIMGLEFPWKDDGLGVPWKDDGLGVSLKRWWAGSFLEKMMAWEFP